MVVAPLPPVALAQPEPPAVESCHCILPDEPLSVRLVPLPEQRVEDVALAVPATALGLTVSVAALEFTDPSILVNTARY